MPYAIENISTGERIRQFGSLPKSFDLPDGRRIISPVKVGDEGLGFRLIEIVEVGFAKPGPYFAQGDDVETRDGNVVTITRQWTPWTQTEIDAYESGLKDQTADEFDDVNSIVRALVLVLTDELNRHSVVHTAILQAAADATSLANFKSEMARITPIPPRSPAQLKAAIRTKLGNGA